MLYDGKIWVGTDESGVPAFLLPQMANRHGLIAGATGTGKTVTLKVIAEGFSRMGVPVFLGDIKGDLSGMIKVGEPSQKIAERLAATGVQAGFEYTCFPTVFWDVYGEQGHPVRTTIKEMGPMLLSRMLSLNEVQTGVLNILFRVAENDGLPLIDLKDLKAMLVAIGNDADKYTLEYGNVSKASIGAIQRAVAVLEDQGGNCFFGEPSLQISDWMQQDETGKGYINVLACDRLFLSPLMYSTFMLWMLTELYDTLPEQGDMDKPRMVFFFDEAHLLFSDCSKQLMSKIEQVVRLIRSKGVGVYFITQNPTDVPMSVLGQLGNRVQHALRAYTPIDQKAVKVAAQTFRANPAFNTEEAITQLHTGEALISFLDSNGAPSVVRRCTILPPQSYMGAIPDSLRRQCLEESPFKGIYDQAVDSDSAYEILNGIPATTQSAQNSVPVFFNSYVNPIVDPNQIKRSVSDMANSGTDSNAVQQFPQAAQPVVQNQGFMTYDPTTGQYVQQAAQPMYQQAAQPVYQQAAQPVYQQAAQPVYQQATQPVYQQTAQGVVQQAAQGVVQQAAQPVYQQTAQGMVQQPQTVQQNVLVQDPATGMYTQKLVTLAYDAASGQYVRVMSEEELKEAAAAKAAAAKEAEKAEAAAAKAQKEALAEERRARAAELREESAERARANNSVLGRVKNTAVQTATRTVVNKLINGVSKSISNAFKKR